MVLVVNWFQIMFLFLVRQPPYVSYQYSSRCELISNYVLIFGSTTHDRFIPRKCSCELISNYVLIFGSTTTIPITKSIIKLWIDFKLCSYFWFDNQSRGASVLERVVNWFQIMFLFLVRQLYTSITDLVYCCELISNYVLIFGSTTLLLLKTWVCLVVNWFQIMFLFLVRQLFVSVLFAINCCELISNYVLIFGSTTFLLPVILTRLLWIDFKLCSYFWFDNTSIFVGIGFSVVNWFQIMFLFLVRQPGIDCWPKSASCELISNYVLIFGSTTYSFPFIMLQVLWIDFKLCSYFWFDNVFVQFSWWFYVVNWFQIMFLFLVRQHADGSLIVDPCCELISNYVLIFGSTTKPDDIRNRIVLWIDFKLCSYFWFDNGIFFEYALPLGCELISNYVLIFGSTTW